MSKINELRAQRAKTWEQTKAFLDSHRSDKGVLSAEDTATYEKMEQEIVDLGREIERQERLGTSSSKNPCGVFGSLCIPPPLMRISRL